MRRWGMLLIITAAIACSKEKGEDAGATGRLPSMSFDSTRARDTARVQGDSTMVRDTVRQ